MMKFHLMHPWWRYLLQATFFVFVLLLLIGTWLMGETGPWL